MKIRLLWIILLLLIEVFPYAGYAYQTDENISEHFNFGKEFFMLKRYNEAIIEFKNVVMIAPDFPEGHLWLGKALQAKGMKEEALSEFKIVLKLDPKNVEVRKILTDKVADLLIKEVDFSKNTEEKGFNIKLHFVRAGDTFKSISKYYFGNEKFARQIAEFNNLETLKGMEGKKIKILIRKGMPLPPPPTKKALKLAEIKKNEVRLKKSEAKKRKSIVIDLTAEKNKKPQVDLSKIVIKKRELKSVFENTEELPEDATYEDKLELCKKNRRMIEKAIIEYNLDHIEELNRENFNIELLVKTGYLKYVPRCPEQGTYNLNFEGKIECTYHTEE